MMLPLTQSRQLSSLAIPILMEQRGSINVATQDSL